MTAIPTHPPPAPAAITAHFIHGHEKLADARKLAEYTVKRFAVEKVGRTGPRTVVDVGAGFSGAFRSDEIRRRTPGVLFHAMCPVSDIQDKGRNMAGLPRKIPITDRTAGFAPNPTRINICDHQLHECDCITAANVQYTATNSAYYFQPKDWAKVTELTSIEHIVDHVQPYVPETEPEYKWERPNWFVRCVQFVTGLDDVKFSPLHPGGHVYNHPTNEWVRKAGGKHIFAHSQKMYDFQHRVHAELVRSPVATTIMAGALLVGALKSRVALAICSTIALARPALKCYEACVSPLFTIHAFSDKTFGNVEPHTEVIKYIRVDGYSPLTPNRLVMTPPTKALQSSADAAILARKSASLDVRANQVRTIISTLARTYSVTTAQATDAVMVAISHESTVTARINRKLLLTYPSYLVGRSFEYSLNCVPSFTLRQLVKCAGIMYFLSALAGGSTILFHGGLQQPAFRAVMKVWSTPSTRSLVELSTATVTHIHNLAVASLASALGFVIVSANAVALYIMGWLLGTLNSSQYRPHPYGTGGLIGITRSVLSTLTTR